MYSEQTAVSGGSLSFLDLTIEYRSRSEITVLFNGVLTTAWSWSGTIEKRILFSPAVAAGVVVKVQRTTDIGAMTHIFGAGASFRNSTMDDDFLQLLHAVQELRERGGSGGGGGSVTGASNVGAGPYQLFKQNALGVLQFRTIAAGPNVSMEVLNDVLTISASGGGGGTPSGPAGGVLAGSYPNPSFAVDMATQAELDSAIATRAPAVHTHAIGSITVPGGTLAGQVPTWNGTSLVMQTPTGGGTGYDPYHIVVIGDSHTADQPNLAPAWPGRLERLINASGGACTVSNLAINGSTFNKANVVSAFGTGRTQRSVAIEAAPDMIIVALGFNDAVFDVESRSLAQIQADALAFFSALRAALPSTTIVYASELAYNNVHATPSTLLNRDVIPFLWELNSSGILAGCYTQEVAPNAVSTLNRNRYANWLALDTYIKGLSQINASFTLPIWKVARLGGLGFDGVHPTAEGSLMYASAARKALQSLLGSLSDQAYPSFSDFDSLFSLLLSSSGTGYVPVIPLDTTANHPVRQKGPWRSINPGRWFYPSKGIWESNSLAYVNDKIFQWKITNSWPNRDVQSSIDGAAWTTVGTTNMNGDFGDAGVLSALTPGTYQFRYKVHNEVYGPFALAVTAGAGITVPWNNVTGKPAYFNGAGAGTLGVGALQALSANVWTRVRFATGANSLVTPGAPIGVGNDSVNGQVYQVAATGLYRVSFTALVGDAAANNLFVAALNFVEPGGANFIVQGGTFYPPVNNYVGTVSISVTLRMPVLGYCVPLLYSLGAGAVKAGTVGGSTNTSHYFDIQFIGATT